MDRDPGGRGCGWSAPESTAGLPRAGQVIQCGRLQWSAPARRSWALQRAQCQCCAFATLRHCGAPTLREALPATDRITVLVSPLSSPISPRCPLVSLRHALPAWSSLVSDPTSLGPRVTSLVPRPSSPVFPLSSLASRLQFPASSLPPLPPPPDRRLFAGILHTIDILRWFRRRPIVGAPAVDLGMSAEREDGCSPRADFGHGDDLKGIVRRGSEPPAPRGRRPAAGGPHSRAKGDIQMSGGASGVGQRE
jgi:hypothetical protein